MKFSQAKPFLKEGMKIKIKGEKRDRTIDYIEDNKIWGKETGCYWPIDSWENEDDQLEILTNPDGSPWVEPLRGSNYEDIPTRQFKVGDRVRGQYGSAKYTGTIKIINEDYLFVKRDDGVDDDWSCRRRLSGEWAAANGYDDGVHNLELIEEPEVITIHDSGIPDPEIWKSQFINPIKKGQNMSLVKALKAKLSPTDRTLVKHGYLTETGERTQKYTDQLIDVIWDRLYAEEDTPEFRKELSKSLKEED